MVDSEDTPAAIGLGFRLQALLEDFDFLATSEHMVLLPHEDPDGKLHENVGAALSATSLGWSNLNKARRRCPAPDGYIEPAQYRLARAHFYAYRAAKNHILSQWDRFATEGRDEPTEGQFAASIVLERLPVTLFCTHLLYVLGCPYEGHSVARVMLEQLAWALVAAQLDDMEQVAQIKTTRAISELQRFWPGAGPLYGFLSTHAHYDLSSHADFLDIVDDDLVVQTAQHRYSEYARVVLRLADLFAMVWEVAHVDHVTEFESLIRDGERLVPRTDRPFVAQSDELIAIVEELEAAQLESS